MRENKPKVKKEIEKTEGLHSIKNHFASFIVSFIHSVILSLNESIVHVIYIVTITCKDDVNF